MDYRHITNRRTTHLLFTAAVAAAVSAAVSGCHRKNGSPSPEPVAASWQRATAVAAIKELDYTTDDNRRAFVRNYAKAILEQEKGGDPDKRFSHGRTLLLMATLRSDKEIVERMLSLDVYADVDCADDKGDTPLIVACRNGNVEIARMLIKAGARINLQNNEGTTALMVCAETGNKAIAKELIEAGADRHLKDKDGRLFGDYASRKGHTDMIPYIANIKSSKGE